VGSSGGNYGIGKVVWNEGVMRNMGRGKTFYFDRVLEVLGREG
jgi:hypothetical protein